MEYDAMERDKAKREPPSRSYHEKMEDKTYAFNYYADKHQRGGLESDQRGGTNRDETGEGERSKHEKMLRNAMNYGWIILSIVPMIILLTGYKRREKEKTIDAPVDQAFLRWVDEIEQQDKERSES